MELLLIAGVIFCFMASSFFCRVVSRLGVGAGLLSLAVSHAEASANETSGVVLQAGVFEPSAMQLSRLTNAADVELWLEREIPVGLTLAEAPEFFAAADEVFFNAEENLFIYAFRSAATGRWVAWVAFDADRTGVVHTAAIDLER